MKLKIKFLKLNFFYKLANLRAEIANLLNLKFLKISLTLMYREMHTGYNP
jgi:hypothetical protein